MLFLDVLKKLGFDIFAGGQRVVSRQKLLDLIGFFGRSISALFLDCVTTRRSAPSWGPRTVRGAPAVRSSAGSSKPTEPTKRESNGLRE